MSFTFGEQHNQKILTTNQADSDAQLFSTLCDIDKQNYLFLFECCKACNVNARHLRYLRKDHIRELIPRTQLGVLAEFEFLLLKWQEKNGFSQSVSSNMSKEGGCDAGSAAPIPPKLTSSMGTMTIPIQTETRGVNTDLMNFPSLTLPSTSGGSATLCEETMSNEFSSGMKCDDDSQCSYSGSPRSTLEANSDRDGESTKQYPLTSIIPTVLSKCQQKYKANRGLLTEVERRLLSAAIIDYFISRKIHLKADIIDNLADQIAHHFPTESKRAWYDRKNCKGRGRLYVKLYNSHRCKDKTAIGKKRRCDTSSTTSDHCLQEEELDTFDEEGQQIQNWLQCNKCEDMEEVINMWNDTLNYRRCQLRRIVPGCEESVFEILNNWPCYKWPDGHLLLAIDFNHLYPHSTSLFHRRWPIYLKKIITLMEVELKDGASVELFKQFKMARNILNSDSSGCILINLLHAITKPSRCFNTSQGVRRFCITDSQNSVLRLITHESEMNSFTEAYPCIFVVGDSLLNIEECFVAYCEIRYKLDFASALQATMHIYALFKVDYPLPSLNFWQFVRGYFFDIHLEDETSYAVMDNIVKYLETYLPGT